MDNHIKVLVTDDDEQLLLLTTSVLRRAGYEALEASTGQECLDVARLHRPDLILLDVMLPDILGLEVLREIKTDPDLRGIFVILQSGIQISSDYQATGLNVGADGYIAKPISNKELLARVQAMERIKQAEDALRESERKHREFADFLPETVVEFDEKGDFSFVNANGLETFGYTREDIERGLNILETIIPEDHDRAREAVRKVLGGGKTYGTEYTMVKKDGAAFPGLIYASPIMRENISAGIRAIVIDITERKKAEEELRASEEKYRRLFDDAVLGVFRSTGDGKIITINPAYARMFGYSSPGELMASVSDVAGDLYADPSRRPAIVQTVQGAKGPVHVENLYKRKDGSTFVGNLHLWHAADADGRSILEGFVEDITERKRMEESLKMAEEQYRVAIEASNDGVAIVQGEKHVYVNRRFLEIFGFEKEDEIVGREGYKVVHPEDRDRVVTYHMERLKGGSVPGTYEFRGMRKDGSVVPIEVSAARILFRDEPATLAYLRDITARKETEEKLKSSLREKEVLLKEIHHRVKNNLQIMSSLLNLQSQYLDDPRALDIFRESIDRVKTMALIHDKLYRSENLSQIYFPIYVADLTRDLVNTYAAGKGIYLNLDVEPVSYDVDTAIPLGLIVNELVSNALKHAFRESIGGTIRIGLYRDGTHATLLVSDNGTGFPENLDFMNTPSMGMQLVVTLVEQLEGAIELKRDKGTEFRITFEDQ